METKRVRRKFGSGLGVKFAGFEFSCEAIAIKKSHQ
jgi:hypothetical protein